MVLNAVRFTMNRIPFPYRALILRKQLFPPHKHSLTNLLVLYGAVYKREHFKFLPHKVYKRNGVQFTNAFFQLSSKLKKRRRNRRNITCLLLNRCTFPEQQSGKRNYVTMLRRQQPYFIIMSPQFYHLSTGGKWIVVLNT